ncbi:DUF3871 family protein [Chryseobacterium gambrini]|uniref:DUF3871 family protein n=1 Tax=Chryseobacterium gambrini TaxID=373672 RepID=UPI0025B28E97|nr:DUF3871 family protein [Chryseobacterium gambrini]MDN4028684.1 DUF3871 family protein [Chryseobacterium gambrini]
MDTLKHIKPATLEQAFDLRPAKSANIIELPKENIINNNIKDIDRVVNFSQNSTYESKPFIEANTQEVHLQHLKNECIIPVFSKDNEKTISHQEFIEISQNCIANVFPNHSISEPEVRVSHQIKGRTPGAIYKNVKDLLDHEKTIYYERIAFIVKIPAITDIINGNELSLTIGGVRAYNQENLYNKKTFEKFKFFVGFQNKVCCNLCVWSDGFVDDLKVSSFEELQSKLFQVLNNYNAEKHLSDMKQFSDYSLTEHQFAQLLGRTRLYQHLPKKGKLKIPLLQFTDGHINTITKDYYEDENFCRDNAGDINLWNLYNLFTQANKSSYIDTFLDRNLNAFDFTKGIQQSLNGSSDYHWFLS